MRTVDNNSNSKYLTFVNFPEKYKYYAYRGLAEFMYDYACSNIDFGSVNFSNTNAATSLVKSIMKSMSGETKSYSYGNIEIKLDIFQLGSSKFGTVVCSEKKNPNTTYEAVICSTQSECYDTIEKYWTELEQLSDKAKYNIYESICKDLFGQSITSYTEKYLKKVIGKYEVQLKASGVGQLASDLNECYNYYSYIQNIMSGDLTSFEGLLEGMGKFKFKDSTITDKAVKKTMSQLEKAKSVLYDAGKRYLAGDLNDGDLKKWWKIQFGCPVNISIYDSTGEKIGYVGKNDIWHTDVISIEENGEGKIINCYTKDQLSFEIMADEYGVLGCSVEEYNENGNALGRYNFYDLSLVPEQKLYINLPEDTQDNENSVVITTEEQKIYSDEYITINDDACVEVVCPLEGEGIVYGEGYYVRGDVVNLLAVPKEGYKFNGWYEQNELVCVSESFEFTIKEDHWVVPKFRKIEYVDVHVSSEGKGTVIGNGRYNLNDTATVYAFQEDNYVFVGWYVDDELISSESQYQFEVTAEISLEARFVQYDIENGVSRIYGSDRYKTAFSTADELKYQLNVEAFDSVIIAVGKDKKEADALAGSYLAKAKNAPILLTNGKDSVNAEVVQYIKENAKKDAAVYILGGEAAIPKTLETELKSLGYQVKRLEGADRYVTNIAVLNEVGFEEQTDLLIAVGNNFADSLSASATGKAILLVKPEQKGQPVSELSEGQKAVLEQFKDGNIYILGGTGAVGKKTAVQIAACVGKTADALAKNRICGADRYETSAKIAEKFFPDAEKAVVAYGKKAADGLSGGSLAAQIGAPLLLTRDGDTTAAEYLTENGISSGYILGGTSAISKETADKLFVMKKD